MRAAALLLPLTQAMLVLALLAACGKKGPPAAPGPQEEIIFPRQYPSR